MSMRRSTRTSMRTRTRTETHTARHDMSLTPGARKGILLGLSLGLSAGAATAAPDTNARPRDALLLDSLGRLVVLPTNQVRHPALLPLATTGLERQIPTPTKGASTPPEILQRIDAAKTGQEGIQFFPSVQPTLMPYLASENEFGNTAARHGALLPVMPIEPLIQGAKYWLSEQGLRY